MGEGPKTGPKTKEYIASLLAGKDHPEQAFRTCAGILRLASSVSKEKMEEVSAEARVKDIYSYTSFAKLLENRKMREPVMHENLRGKDYYKGEDHV